MHIRRRARAFAVLATLAGALLAACSPARLREDPPAPSSGGGGMVSSAHPLATRAGVDVLQGGGSAIDAAIAVQAMLGLVEPQSSGLAGGAFLLHYRARDGQVDAYLGRERAPSGADAALFLDSAGDPLPRSEAMLSGRATGVPGVLPALEAAHADHGRLPWSTLFSAAAETATTGFSVTPRLHRHIVGNFPQASAPDVARLFSGPGGQPLRIGEVMRNPAYARSLQEVATRGAAALQTGPLAEALLGRIQEPPGPSPMRAEDLAGYRAEKVRPLCRTIRAHVVCVPPPPSSGVGLLQLLLLLEGTDIAGRSPDDPLAWLTFAEASRLMYADRDHYVGDPDFVEVPIEGMLNPDYLDSRRRLLGERAAAGAVSPGVPAGAPANAGDDTAEPAGTSHFVVVDGEGNAVSMTTTIESYFGSGRVVGGMLLNNQLTDFSWQPGGAAANAIAPGKRPRSSMSPVIVLDPQGNFAGAIGSPGGNAIPAYIGKTLLGWLFWDLPLDQAIALPNLVARGERHDGEADALAPALRQALEELGVRVRPGSGEDSGLHGVQLRSGRLHGAADPRREGVAIPTTPPNPTRDDGSALPTL
ncbi:gamma-glutamyltransferase family protein [Lysobacter sp. GX 14042]|uniref:gamma-glutamyltransferase family protein n=1 Tax=Lysobacter sp. GX 14042 TaxID=2907155 RepID=UPI001F490C40|nr:gamma-glutamyltransferase family protein [Lysobacter sp. GX 14042]MCE7033009.1 gamma-glutamyltransferase family protein [Lysobacter sp. GX 14042]